jgi:chorismate mutase / prephenate dehydrogenase
MNGDEQLDALRARITELDRAIFELVNQRLELVRELKQVKDDHDLPFVDPVRETAMIEQRMAENPDRSRRTACARSTSACWRS